MYRPRFATHATNAIHVPDFDQILTHQGTHLDIEREEFFSVEQWAGVLARAARWALIHRPATTGRIPIATGNAASEYFAIPPNRVVELGALLEM
jgi:K+ transporter